MKPRTLNRELLMVIAFYAIFCVLHYVTVAIDKGRMLSISWVVINYSLKAVFTLPLVWLFFKKLERYPLWKKALLHLITMPVFTFIWITTNYLICDSMGIFRLRGAGAVWDIYLTLLFYSIQFGFFHVYQYARNLKEQELFAAELSRLNAQSELSALKAQLNPHFLYNVFNTINAAIPTTAQHARNMVHELSDLFRYQLQASKSDLVPLKDELEFVRKYLDLEKERFGSRLDFEVYSRPEADEVLIPPLIIQPLVENAIKHGISPLIEGGKVVVNVQLEEVGLHISVCDSGKGLQGVAPPSLFNKGVGLSNTNERLLKLYGTGLSVEENGTRGCCVKFSIPINHPTLGA